MISLIVAGVTTMMKESQHGMTRKEYIQKVENELNRRAGNQYAIQVNNSTPGCDTWLRPRGRGPSLKVELNDYYDSPMSPAQAAQKIIQLASYLPQ